MKNITRLIPDFLFSWAEPSEDLTLPDKCFIGFLILCVICLLLYIGYEEQNRQVRIIISLSGVNFFLGIALLLFGYRLFRLFIALLGFFWGIIVSFPILMSYLVLKTDLGQQDSFVISLILSIIIGVAVSLLNYFLHMLQIFSFGGIVTSLLFIGYAVVNNITINTYIIISAFIVGGIISLVIHKFIVVFGTSIIGSCMLVMGLYGFRLAMQPNYLSFYIYALLIPITFIYGLLYQYHWINTSGISIQGHQVRECK